MGTKKENYNRVNKGWKILSICVGCMLLIALSISQVAFAKEEEETAQAQEAQTAQMQEEVQETSQTQESTENTSQETSQTQESTPQETSQTQESTEGTSQETSQTQESTPTESETSVEQVAPRELDLGDYMTEMSVGDKQLLIVTILPEAAAGASLSYSSSNTNIATVNGMGRITALNVGTTTITVTCKNISESFELTVKEAPDTEIEVTELDLGDCPKEITIGTSQIMSVSVIPADATEIEFRYESSNSAIVSVNALGRLTAHALGTAQITVYCGNVSQKFTVTVVKDKTKVEVMDIEISDFDDELKVDSTLNLSVTVLPKDATEADITYKSSDLQIATVNSSGEVKGIAPGEVTIYISAGKITKQVQIKVKTATESIEVDSDYQVMKPGDAFQIKAKVRPSDAPQNITYKSMDTNVAEVSAGGKVTAKACGSTAIVVSNGDVQVSVNIIVNKESISLSKEEQKEIADNGEGAYYPSEVTVDEYPVITTDMLKYYYEKEKALTIKGEGYTIYLDGKNIVNFENELDTKLIFEETDNGFIIVINEEKKLCGQITIDISPKVTNEKYLYLYNQEKEKYQIIKIKDITLLQIDTAGRYLITAKKLTGLHINILFVVVGCAAVVVGVGVYIGVKKKYWFW